MRTQASPEPSRTLSNRMGLFCVQQNMELSLRAAENKAVSVRDTHTIGMAVLTDQCAKYSWQPMFIRFHLLSKETIHIA